MGHRALVAYERPDRQYNVHYTHWGALHLRLKQDITPRTPFGSDGRQAAALEEVCDELCEAESEQAVAAALADDLPSPQVDIEPRAVQVSLETIITEYLDFLHHEAFYVVDREFAVTAYRTHWFGLQYDCVAIEDAPTIGNGALRTVRWYDGEPVSDGFVQGQFHALKDVVGDMIDRGVFTHATALEYLEEKLHSWVGDEQALLIRTPADVPTP